MHEPVYEMRRLLLKTLIMFFACVPASRASLLPRLAPSMPIDQRSATQAQRPTAVARQIGKEEEKLRSTFERDLGLGVAQPDEWQDRLAPLQRRATELISGQRISDWQGDELRSLALMYAFTEQHSLVIEACRKLIAEPATVDKDDAESRQERMVEARVRLVRAMIELDRIEDAAVALDELDRVDTFVLELLAARVLLHRDLGIAYRQSLQLDKAVRQAYVGYEIGRRISPRPFIADQARDARDIETARLAAMAVALFERLGQKKNAEEMQRRWRQTGRGRPAQSETTFENELITQRLLGRPAPELAAKAWIGSSPLTSTSLRGKVVLLHFWAMWNTASTSRLDRLNKWQADFKDRGFQVVGVTRLFGRSDRQDGLSAAAEMASLESFRERSALTFPIAVAGLDDVTNDERFNTTTLPMFVLIDRQGMIRRIDREGIDYRNLAKEIDNLTANRQVGWNN